ncbi:MAG TPA: response regulator [Syntrophales bacterium]|nr:response regulator [Syntrophales bacterium]
MEKKILVVDDEEVIRNMLQEFLSKNGYVVRLAESAETALDILRGESFMVMFLDLKLPGISGMELCRKIRIDNDVGIIYAFTGYTDLFGLIDCRRAGFDDYFTKPVKLELILQAAQDAFAKLERWNLDEYDLT